MRFPKQIFTLLVFLLSFTSFFFVPEKSQAQGPYSNSGKYKYVKTTVDTFGVPGVSGVLRHGFVTNESATKYLLVIFSRRDGTKDTSSRVTVPPNKTLHFAFVGTKIFRNAVSDSALSQIIIGDVQLNYNEAEALKDLCNYEVVNQTDAVFAYHKPSQYINRKNYTSLYRKRARNDLN